MALILIGPLSSLASSQEIYLVERNSKTELIYIVTVRQINSLAGIKLRIDYPEQLLTFLDASKSEATSNFLHVVNDKTPGHLIIVMASAKGISGNDIPLVQLTFKTSTVASPSSLPVSISQCQLMSDTLKDFPCKIDDEGLK